MMGKRAISSPERPLMTMVGEELQSRKRSSPSNPQRISRLWYKSFAEAPGQVTGLFDHFLLKSRGGKSDRYGGESNRCDVALIVVRYALRMGRGGPPSASGAE